MIETSLKMHLNRTRRRGVAGETALMFAALACCHNVGLAADAGGVLEEIVVTADKRAARSINDIAMSITAVSSQDLQSKGIAGMADYLSTLPGVSFVDVGYASNNVIVRGLTTNPVGTGRPALSGMYFGETTLTGLVGLSSDSNPDVKLVDIERIELLPGPQGTLYGDASMSGALRIIPAAPRTDAFEGKLSASYGTTEHTDEGNYDVQAVVNMPLLEDKLALRVVGYRFNEAGFIKNIAGNDPVQVGRAQTWGASAPVERVGGREYTGGRAALRWQATDNFSLTLGHLYQQFDQDGGSFNRLGVGDRYWQSNYGGESSDSHFGLTSLDLTYDWSWASLLSSTAWVDGTSASAADQEFGPGATTPLFQLNDYRNTALTEEVRLSSRLPGKLQWLVGAFYQDRRLQGAGGPGDSSIRLVWNGAPAVDPFGGAEILSYQQIDRTKQTALFGEVSYEVLPQLTATVGLRYYDYEKENHTIATGLFIGGVASDSFLENQDSGSTGKLNVSYQASDDALLFATYSEGFRLGGPHSLLPRSTCDLDNDGLVDGPDVPFPTQVGSDETRNVELGTKLTLLDRRLQLNASVFNVDWKGIPVDLPLQCGFLATLNAGDARSRGVEVSGELMLRSFRASYTASYTDAELTRDAPSVGSDGDRLPGSPRVNASLGLQYDFSLAGREAFVRTDIGYVGEYFRDLQQSQPPLGDYTTVGLRTGLSFGNVDVELFGQNLTNESEMVWFDAIRNGGILLRPRTIGIELRYDFSER